MHCLLRVSKIVIPCRSFHCLRKTDSVHIWELKHLRKVSGAEVAWIFQLNILAKLNNLGNKAGNKMSPRHTIVKPIFPKIENAPQYQMFFFLLHSKRRCLLESFRQDCSAVQRLLWPGLSRYSTWQIVRLTIQVLRFHVECVWGVVPVPSNTNKTAKRERERWKLLKQPSRLYAIIITQKPAVSQGAWFLITDVTRKTRESSNATNPWAVPPALHGNGPLATQHAAQISSGSEITEHRPTSVELSAGTGQHSGPASCRLIKPLFSFERAK